MQATVASRAAAAETTRPAPGSAAREPLIRDMYALASFLMRSSNVGTFNRIAELDLSFTQIKALCAMDLDESEPSLKELAESMKVSLPAMSRAVDGLYVRGLVDRCEDPDDRRMKRIRPTDGRAGGVRHAERGAADRDAGVPDLARATRQARALARALELILADRPEIAALRPAHEEIAELPHPEPPHPQKGAAP